MKDFIITRRFCPHCAALKLAKVFSQTDIDLIDISSGDPRIESMVQKYGNISKENLPIGEINGGNTFINFSRDAGSMYILFGGKQSAEGLD